MRIALDCRADDLDGTRASVDGQANIARPMTDPVDASRCAARLDEWLRSGSTLEQYVSTVPQRCGMRPMGHQLAQRLNEAVNTAAQPHVLLARAERRRIK